MRAETITDENILSPCPQIVYCHKTRARPKDKSDWRAAACIIKVTEK